MWQPLGMVSERFCDVWFEVGAGNTPSRLGIIVNMLVFWAVGLGLVGVGFCSVCDISAGRGGPGAF